MGQLEMVTLLCPASELRVRLDLVMVFLLQPWFRFAYRISLSDEQELIDKFFEKHLESVAQREWAKAEVGCCAVRSSTTALMDLGN